MLLRWLVLENGDKILQHGVNLQRIDGSFYQEWSNVREVKEQEECAPAPLGLTPEVVNGALKECQHALATNAMSEWKPIETAPKDGSWILAYAPQEQYDDEPEITAVCWGTINYNWPPRWVWGPEGRDHGFRHGFYEPTHWMPLPEAPTQRSK